ncbi:MAG: glycosyltransferase family 9 protein [Candidatus Omnitrophota bacterium]
MTIDIKKINKILIINLGGIGDMLLSIPALKALSFSLPQVRISLLTMPRSVEVIKGYQFVDDIILYKRGLKNKFSLIFTLKKIHPNMAINMRPLTSLISAIKMAILFVLTGAKYRVGRDIQKRGFFLNIKVPEVDVAESHDLDYYLGMLKILGIKSTDDKINLIIDKLDTDYVEDILKKHGIEREDIVVGINPGASLSTRRWPLEKFSSLSELILKMRKCKIAITGSESEVAIAEKLQHICKADLINLAGRTTVGQLMALIKRCNLFISNDAGPVHLAAALHTPLIAIFRAGDIVRYDPRRLSDKFTIVMYNKTSCSPCLKARCTSMICLRDITPENVLKEVSRLI